MDIYPLLYIAVDFLRYNRVHKLPINAEKLRCKGKIWNIFSYPEAKDMIKELDLEDYASKHDGFAISYKGEFYILYRIGLSQTDKRKVIFHEMSHIVLDHVSDGIIVGKTNDKEVYDKQEEEADLLARYILAPIPILAKAKISSSEAIQAYTGLSKKDSKKIAADIAFSLLDKRADIEDKLNLQFAPFILKLKIKNIGTAKVGSFVLMLALCVCLITALSLDGLNGWGEHTNELETTLTTVTTTEEIITTSAFTETTQTEPVTISTAEPTTEPTAPVTTKYIPPTTKPRQITTTKYIPPTAAPAPPTTAPAATTPPETTSPPIISGTIYYWSQTGEVYHIKKTCSALKNVKYPISEGTLEKALESAKKRPCELCTVKKSS